MNTTWSESAITALKAAWGAGASATTIAASREFIDACSGRLFSRNAILGKLNRMGVVRERIPGVKNPNMDRTGVSAVAAAGKPRRRRGGLLWRTTQLAALAPARDPAIDPVPFMELGPDCCRWPVGHDGYLATFCPSRRREGQTYCDRHRRESVNRTSRLDAS